MEHVWNSAGNSHKPVSCIWNSIGSSIGGLHSWAPLVEGRKATTFAWVVHTHSIRDVSIIFVYRAGNQALMFVFRVPDVCSILLRAPLRFHRKSIFLCFPYSALLGKVQKKHRHLFIYNISHTRTYIRIYKTRARERLYRFYGVSGCENL